MIRMTVWPTVHDMPNRTAHDELSLLTQAEVMDMLRVSRRTLLRYEDEGILQPVKLPSGHRRYRRTQIDAIVNGEVSA